MGKPYLEEGKMFDKLTKGNHNLDWQLSILFAGQADERGFWPMMYPCNPMQVCRPFADG